MYLETAFQITITQRLYGLGTCINELLVINYFSNSIYTQYLFWQYLVIYALCFRTVV